MHWYRAFGHGCDTPDSQKSQPQCGEIKGVCEVTTMTLNFAPMPSTTIGMYFVIYMLNYWASILPLYMHFLSHRQVIGVHYNFVQYFFYSDAVKWKYD